MLLEKKSYKFLLCTVSAFAIYSSSFMLSTHISAQAETVEIGIDGAKKTASLSDAIEKRLSSKFRKISKSKKWSRGALVRYYADADYQPLWVDEKGLNQRAQTLLKVIGRSEKHGLRAADFKIPFTTKHIDEEDISSVFLARVELELSLAALKYIDTARNGRFVPTKLSRFMDGSYEKIDAVAALNKISDSRMIMGYLESYNPTHPQYKALEKQLAAFNSAKTAEVKVITVPVVGPTLKVGMLHPHAAILRKRLKVGVKQVEGNPLYSPALYDATLAEAVAKFQKSKGLKADGIVGRRTRLAMNEGQVSRNFRKKQILANMERWRWLPSDLGKNHILVNIPEYKVRVIADGNLVHKERVIVGKVANKTPFFSDQMEKVVFNPYWNVPQSIIANEMNYSVPRGYEGHYNNGMLHVRQPPGPRNALGKVKFLFPNKHAVYLHDTPSKKLFNAKVRAFSHGCMRVRDPKRMAEVILSIGYKGSSQKLVNRHWRTLRNAELPLDTKIPVHVVYFTAWSDDDGKMQYFNDIYKHDKRIVTVLNGGRVYLEPKQRIKKRKPVYDSYDDWGFGGNDRYSNRNKRRGYKKKRYSNNFWDSSPKPRRKHRRRRSSSFFDPFDLGW